jgi:hypothetical protein
MKNADADYIREAFDLPDAVHASNSFWFQAAKWNFRRPISPNRCTSSVEFV